MSWLCTQVSSCTFSFWLLIFIALCPRGLSLGELDSTEDESASPPWSPLGRSNHVLTGKFRAPDEGRKPVAPPTPKGAVTGCTLSPSTPAWEKWLSRTTKSMYILYHIKEGKQQQGQERLGLWRMFQQRWLMVLKETPTVFSNFFPISHKVTPSFFLLFYFSFPFLLPVFDLESRLVICVMTAKIKDLCTVCMGI